MLGVIVTRERSTPAKTVPTKYGHHLQYPRFNISHLCPVRIVGERPEIYGDPITVFTYAVGNPVGSDGILASTSVDGLELRHKYAEVRFDYFGQRCFERGERFAVDVHLAQVPNTAGRDRFGQGKRYQRNPLAFDQSACADR
jgi:hypothetical protein